MHYLQPHLLSDEKQCTGSSVSSECPPSEGCNRRGLPSEHPRVLQSAVSCSKGEEIFDTKIDLLYLNTYLIVPKFHMETQASVRSTIRKQERTVSKDTNDAYLHVPPTRTLWKFLRFMMNGSDSVHQPAVWPSLVTLGVYQGSQSGGTVATQKWGEAPWLPVWLADQCKFTISGLSPCRLIPPGSWATRMGSELWQIIILIFTWVPISRYGFQYQLLLLLLVSHLKGCMVCLMCDNSIAVLYSRREAGPGHSNWPGST